jgi:hypothetical protein
MLGACLAACHTLPASALQPLVTDDADIQGRGGNQIEIAFERERFHAPEGRTVTRTATLVYTRGATDSVDGSIGLSRLGIRSDGADSVHGNGNPTAAFKWRFWKSEAHGLMVSVKSEVQFGVSAQAERRGLGNGRTGYAATLLVSKEAQFGAIHANVSVARVGYDLAEDREANRRMLYRASVAPVVALSPEWRMALDIGAVTNPDRTRRARMGFVELGAIWSPHEDLELALGLIAYVGDGEPERRVLTAGVTWRF